MNSKISNYCGFSYIIFFSFLALGSFINPSIPNSFPANAIFEFLLISIVAFSLFFSKISKLSLIFFFYSLLYILWQFFYFKFSDSKGGIGDFLLIHKVFIYLMLLFCIGKVVVFNSIYINRIYKILVILMFLKYSMSHVFSLSDRPGVFTENNFEIMLLLFLFLAKVRVDNNFNFYDLTMLIFLILMSGSRSGILGLACLLFFIDLKKFGISHYMKFLFLILVSFLGVGLFISRLNDLSLEDIDRFKFLLAFIQETESWSFYQWVFGMKAISPLSPESVVFFNFYKTLFSDYQNGIAFSVLFHSFLLRTIFDHGFFGLIFIVCSLYYTLKKAGVLKNDLAIIFSILFVNSLSVSSLNSIYAIWGIVFILSATLSSNIDRTKHFEYNIDT